MKFESKIMSQIASLYMFLPFLILIMGWVKLIVAIPLSILLTISFLFVCKASPKLWIPKWDRDTIIRVLFILGVIAIWVYYSGIGKQVFQNTDHIQRNAIFNILVQYEWPVINYDILESNVGTMNATSLIYYIGFWLPAALVGKAFGLMVGYYAQWLWAFIGIVLVYYFICAMHKRIVVWPLFLLIFFSGLDIVGVFLANIDIAERWPIWHLEWWSGSYQYSSMTTQLFWVFNQAIPAWLCTILIYLQKNNRNIVFLLACCMLPSTFPFVGLLLLCLFWCLTREYDISGITKKERITNWIKCLLKDTCSFQNIVGGGIIGIVSFLYLIGNCSGKRIMGGTQGTNNSLTKYMIFIILEIGIYVVLLYKDNEKNKLFYFITICLCIIPPIKVGYSSDFCMRASVPALFMLMILIMETLEKSWKRKGYGIFCGLIVALIIGSITPIMEMRRTIFETFYRIDYGLQIEEVDDEAVNILNSPNFSGNIEDNLFFKYLAK